MYLSQLKLRRFKSFKYVNIEFPDGFVCLAGPNGSGKSNICDSIRFVLGEQSLRSLRVRSVRELIYSTSNSAEVIAIFEDSKNKEKYEIRRIIQKDGKMIYQLNGARVTRTLILDTLKKYNLDESGRNIIAQGRIQRIVEMTGRERREVIEGVAGISSYDKKKKEAIKELDLVGLKIREANIVIGERSARLNELKKEKEIALKYKHHKEQLKLAKSTLIKIDLDALNSSFDSVLINKSKFKEAIENRTAQLEETDSKIYNLDKERVNYSKQIRELQSNSGGVQNIEELKAAIEVKTKLIGDREKSILKLEEEKNKLENEINAEGKKSKEVISKLDFLKSELKKLAPSKDTDLIDSKSKQFNVKLEANLKEIDKFKSDISELLSKINTSNEILSLKSSQLNEIELEMGSNNGFDDSVDEQALSLQIGDISKEISRLFDDERKINYELANLDKELLKVREKSVQLKVRSSPRARNPVLSVISDLKSSGKIDGIYGSVMDLISFDGKYNSAVESALGGRLFYIVVDSTSTATKLISILKKMKSGRATFIPLDRIKVRSLDRSKNLLLNYVSFNQEVSLAMDFVFSDTILVDSINEAKKIRDSRVVTLDGELFEKSGMITGGRTGGNLFVASQIQKLDDEAEKLKERRKEFLFRLEDIRETGNRNRKEKAELEVKLRAIEIEKRAFSEDKKRNERMKEQGKKLSKEINDLKENILVMVKEKNLLDKKYSSMIEKVEEMKEKVKIEEENERKIYEQMNEKKTQLVSKISSLKAKIEGGEKEFEIRKTNMRNSELKLNDLKNNISEIFSQINQMKRELPELNTRLKNSQEKLKKSGKEVEELFSKLNKIEEGIKNLGEVRGSIKIKIDKIYKEKHELDIKEATIKTKLVDLKSEYEEYGEDELSNIIELPRDELQKMFNESESILNSISSVNIASIELYDSKMEEMNSLKEKIVLLKDERKAVLNMIKEIEMRKNEIFFETFNSVNDNFKRMMKSVPLGEGHLNLLMGEDNDPFNAKLLIKIKKNGRESSISSLSGGESSLLALAFIFAIQFFKPSPFYILDEADAALDKQNSKYFAELVSKISKDSQFITVSHNDKVIGSANAVLGITKMKDGTSKIVGVKLD